MLSACLSFGLAGKPKKSDIGAVTFSYIGKTAHSAQVT
jgi:hypothetical protein